MISNLLDKADNFFKTETDFYKKAKLEIKLIIGLRLLIGITTAAITGLFFILFGLLSEIPPPPIYVEISLMLFFASLFFCVFLLILPWRCIVIKKTRIAVFFTVTTLNILFPFCGAFLIIGYFSGNPPTITEYYSYFLGENLILVFIYFTILLSPIILIIIYNFVGKHKKTRQYSQVQ